MTHRATVFAIVMATWALSACGMSSPDSNKAFAYNDGPRLLAQLQPLPDGHPPVPGFTSPPTLPEGHPPVPGLDLAPALPEGHPRCPVSELTETPPSDAGLHHTLHSPPELIST